MSKQLSWYFNENTNSDIKGRDDDVFENRKSSVASELLAREIVQNVIDSRYDKKQPAKLRLTYIDKPTKKAKDIIKDIIGDLYHSYLINTQAIKKHNPDEMDTNYLLIEDYNTTGLEGDYKKENINRWRYLHGLQANGSINKTQKEEIRKMDLLSWKLAEGASGKGSSEMGSRGLGKRALHHASYFKSCLEISKRVSDGKVILGGTCRLNDILVKNDTDQEKSTYYSHLGYFGLREDNWCKPIEENSLTEHVNFCESLGGSRDVSGTSFVIPYLRHGDPDQIFNFMIKNFYLSIHSQEIILEYNRGDKKEQVGNHNLLKYLRANDMHHEEEYLTFYEECINRTDDDSLMLKDSACDDKQFTKNDFKTKEEFEEFRRKVKGGYIGHLKVPMNLKSANDGKINQSYFHVFISKHSKSDPKTTSENSKKSNKKLFRDKYFIEEGLDLERIRNSKYKTLTLIKKTDQLAHGFVRDAEDANHKDLHHNNSKITTLWNEESCEQVVSTIKVSAKSLIQALDIVDEVSDQKSSIWFSRGTPKKEDPIPPTPTPNPPSPVPNPESNTNLIDIDDSKKGRVEFSANHKIPKFMEDYYNKGVVFTVQVSSQTRDGEPVPFLINITNKKIYDIVTDDNCELLKVNKKSFQIKTTDIGFHFNFLYKEIDTLPLNINVKVERLR